MASTQITTTTYEIPFAPHAAGVVKAGARLYAVYQSGSNLEYRYSDDDGGSWSSATVVAASAVVVPAAFYDSVNGRLNIVYSGANNGSQALRMRAITSNVATGAPGALTTETTIDAGGANAGIEWAYALHSPTGSNPRYWVVASKYNALDTVETRAWFCAAGSSADTGGNWSSTNFTNLGTNSNAETAKQGIGFHWTVGGADKVTLIFGTQNSSPFDFEAVTFDPAAATPTPGTVTSGLFALAGAGGTFDHEVNGPPIAAHAKADYAVFGRLDRNTGAWTFYKSTNGTSWSTPSGWSSLTMGRAQLALSGGDFYLVYSETYGAAASTAQALKYRLISTSSDAMGGATAFSDTNGNIVGVPRDTGASKLYAVYRGSTASPYTLRSDSLTLGGGSDVTPPGAATITPYSIDNTIVYTSAVMPADSDVSQYEIRYLTGSTAPASNRSNGTVAAGPNVAVANGTYNDAITGLASGTRITGRVFVKDTAGNWNTGTIFTAVPVTRPAFVNRYRADGVTVIPDAVTAGGNNVILEFQLAATDFETGAGNAHFRLRVGYDNVTPPSQSFFDMTSTQADGTFKYESSPTIWTTVPSGGLTSGNWGKKLRVYTATAQTSQYGSLRIEQ